ncbi:hypothetical protein JQC67_16035 [Aurantibacter crassamenti]|uniref:hypothetical protein n=1 Tax=Aurantibacter crassamenti TaxID=1837375 RepID=UPI00193AA696|nr:hypothetical protein [Aurantibacter crassamenti]MBM1107667.1 hypothetical protein [Aurantibacter crassamenti]
MKCLLEKLSKKQLLIGSLISTTCYFIASYFLDILYLKSKFSVPYFEAQTSFDAKKIKVWYQELIDFGTIDTYYQTQYFDFLFIATVIAMGYFVWFLFGSMLSKNTMLYKNKYQLSIFLPLAGLFDILENLVSFIMLASPTSFNDNLVYLYSGFASLKFLCWSIAIIILIILIIAVIYNLLFSKRKFKNI